MRQGKKSDRCSDITSAPSVDHPSLRGQYYNLGFASLVRLRFSDIVRSKTRLAAGVSGQTMHGGYTFCAVDADSSPTLTLCCTSATSLSVQVSWLSFSVKTTKATKY